MFTSLKVHFAFITESLCGFTEMGFSPDWDDFGRSCDSYSFNEGVFWINLPKPNLIQLLLRMTSHESAMVGPVKRLQGCFINKSLLIYHLFVYMYLFIYFVFVYFLSFIYSFASFFFSLSIYVCL